MNVLKLLKAFLKLIGKNKYEYFGYNVLYALYSKYYENVCNGQYFFNNKIMGEKIRINNPKLDL